MISFFCFVGAIEDSGFYCQSKQGEYDICRRCPSIDKKCVEDPSGCYCENIELKDPTTGNFHGGSDCNDGFCYVSQSSECTDALTPEGYDPYAYALDVWHHDKIFRSKLACQSPDRRKMDTGNEERMVGVKIVGDALHTVTATQNGDTVKLDPGTKEPFVLYTETDKDCMEECRLRCGHCGAWSYDDINGDCYLHTADACCGQKGKQEKDSGWISGYFCIKCWSTGSGTECPCSLKKRLEGQLGCSIAQNSGANDPQYKNPSGLLRVDTIKVNQDKCACIPKTITRRRRRRRVCRKPVCHDETLNPQGICRDQRRCRKPRPKRNRNNG